MSKETMLAEYAALEARLSKLKPGSRAYQKVEDELMGLASDLGDEEAEEAFYAGYERAHDTGYHPALDGSWLNESDDERPFD